MKENINGSSIQNLSVETRAFADSFPIMILECDGGGNLLFASSKAREFLRIDETLKDLHISSLVTKSEAARLNGILSSLFKGELSTVREEFVFLLKDSSEIPCFAVIEHRSDVARFVLLDIGDISSVHRKVKDAERRHKALVEHAVYQALHDSLTDIFNKDMFLTRLEVELMKGARRRARGSRIAITCIGLDRFKKINDVYGTRVGDMMLQQAARRLQGAVRSDDIVSRFDGDKFMILFTEIASSDDVPLILQKIFAAFNEPCEAENESIKCSISIGVCLFPDDAQDETSLIKNAEEAMYNAKNRGGNSYQFFDKVMHDEMIRRSILENDMLAAIRENEFVTYFQPKVDKDGIIVGMESLIRWYCPRRKAFISPMDFIPIAEKNGKIVDIGYNVLFQSCAQNKKWIDEGLCMMKVSVNISLYQFRQRDLVETIRNILSQTRLDPKYLDLEITESGILENEEENIRKLNELHDMGISITIDDFGTGYSSLSKLKEFPIGTLKIDKKFVDALPYDRKSVTIARAIIDLAHNLEFSVVSEGIENPQQLQFLVEHGCDEFQGFYFSKPVCADEFELLIKKGSCMPRY